MTMIQYRLAKASEAWKRCQHCNAMYLTEDYRQTYCGILCRHKARYQRMKARKSNDNDKTSNNNGGKKG